VVDCFDALTSDRPYRKRLDESQAIAILQERRGTMYDPLVVDVFLDMQRNWVATANRRAASRDSPYRVALTVPLQPL
jgi:HD-GYP domain-containing protein (c-di-GMP phosphodiesterase class II)